MVENIIFLQQVRDSMNTTLDVLLANVSAAANIGQNAANSVTISANNGSVRIANQVNFVNTSNIKVIVTAGEGANANVAFDFVAAVSGNPAGSNTWMQFNNNGSFGATSNVTYNLTTNSTNVNGVFVLNGTNLASNLATIYAKANTPAVLANGTLRVGNTGNINFNNTATINVAVTANGTQANVEFSVNTSSVQSGGGTITDYSSLAPSGCTTFTITANATSASYVIVSRNGIMQVPGTHYSIGANGGGYQNQLIFTTGLELNDVVDARIFSTSIAQAIIGTPGGANQMVQFNDTGILGGGSGLLFNKNGNILTITNGSIVNGTMDIANTLVSTYTKANSAANTVSVSANGVGWLNSHNLSFINTVSTLVHVTDVGNGTANVSFDSQVLLVTSLSDLITPLTTGAAKGYLISPKSFTITMVRATLANMSLSGNVSVGIRNLGQVVGGNIATYSGGTSIMAPANCNCHVGWMRSSDTASGNANPPVTVTSGLVADGDLLIFDINAAGSAATGLMVQILGTG